MPECTKCVEGSGNTVGHVGRHRVVLPKQFGEKRNRAQLDDGEEDTPSNDGFCGFCLKGSGNLAGHRGRHVSKTKVPKPAKQEGPCTLCIEGSNNMAGHRGRHQSVKKMAKVTEGPCPKCIEGDKQVGHRGRHVGKSSIKKDIPTPSPEGEACQLCFEGSDKVAGHRGRHVLKREAGATIAMDEDVGEDATVVSPSLIAEGSEVVLMNAVALTPCSRCIKGSGNLIGHRGRHLFKKKEKKVMSGIPGRPCETCIEGSGNLAGHRGRHRQ